MYLFAALAWTLAMLVAFSLPAEELPPMPGLSFDKLVHFVFFGIFGALWLRALRHRGLSGRRTFAYVLVGGLAYAVGAELYQLWVIPGRTADPYDALANVLGLLAILAWGRWRAAGAREAPVRS